MAIVKWKRASAPEAAGEIDSLDLLDLLQDDWGRLLGWSKFPATAGLFDRSISPAVDVLESQDECIVWVDVPGLDKKDLELSIAANVLTLKGEKKTPARTGKGERVYRDETWTGSFQRSLTLPESIDPNQVSAEVRDGVLKVTIAKKVENIPRQIPVAVR